MKRPRLVLLSAIASAGLIGGRAAAEPTVATGDAGGAGTGTVSGCVESIPKGAERPEITERFPPRGTSGWAATLAVTVRHGKGERVLPAGLDLSNATEMKKVLEAAGFGVPEQSASAGARLFTEADDKTSPKSTTHLDLPLVLLPPKPGRNALELPPLPVAVARANGEIATVCTRPHGILVEDPIAGVPEAMPKPNPLPRPQREEWTSLKRALAYGSVGLLTGALAAYVVYRILTKPKPVPPPPPPRPPWEVALERLEAVRGAGLLEGKRFAEYFDRVSDAVRGYLGARFGFDGLESTTDEILAALKKHGAGFVRLEPTGEGPGPAPGIPLAEIATFLAECDLVKFANLTPSPDHCTSALLAGERIVRSTMPIASAAPSAPPPAPSPPSSPSSPSPPTQTSGGST